MNIFVIPSWYPSASNPIAGIFFKEQIEFLASCYAEYKIGVSIWGQNDPKLQITVKNLSNIVSVILHLSKEKKSKKKLSNNLTEYYSPAFTVSHKLGGNMSKLIKLNKAHFNQFKKSVGKVDVIHAHVSYPAGFIAMKLAEAYDVPYVITEHMAPFPFPQFLTKDGNLHKSIKLPLSKASKLIAVSPALAETIIDYGVKRPQYIPNVIDEDYFRPIPLPHKRKDFIFFTLCLISKQKGIDDLLQAYSEVIKVYPNTRLHIGGTGINIDYYKNLALELKVEKNLTWLGQLSRSQAKIEFNSCNAFVLPSHFETFGVVYAEALACGKPIIATKCGGPEAIVNETNGLIVEVGDIKAIAESMVRMIEEYSLFNPQAIRADFEKRFSKKAVLPQIINVYKSIICAV
ncbi:glycosyltransferase [Pontibacter vulgaris]|uniref:glycosyltransferase n=1 Tax=Pontibacter vulgaris TaxID=2905679 RepID=UPI001FA7D4AA|nr:glycosyltransferase [Pontibacter vulgaris]